MKKFILIILTIAVLFSGTIVYLLARSLNADSYQQQIISAVSDLTGRKMTVSGNTSFKWLPMPTLVMNGIRLSNHSGSDKTNMLTADSLRIQIEWGSLFESPLVIKNVEVVNPTLNLERLASNRANWDFPFFSEPDADISDTQFLGKAQPSASMKIDRLNIKNGTIFYDNKVTEQTKTLKNINGDLNITSLRGPYQFDGTLLIGSKNYSNTLKIDSITNDIPTKLSAVIREKDSGLNLDFNGEVTLNDPKKVISGDASFSVTNPEPLLTELGIPVLNDTLKQSAVGSFAIEIAPLENKLKNLILRFGPDTDPFALTMTVTHTPKTPQAPASYRGEMAVSSLNYDIFKPYFDKLNWSTIEKDVTLPSVQMNVTLPQLILPTGTVKDMTAAVILNKNQIDINSAKAVLPGNMPVVFRINNGINQNTPYLQTHVKGETTNAEALFSFLGLNVPEMSQSSPENKTPSVPIGKLIKSIGTDATIIWTPNACSVNLSTLDIDNTSVTGMVAFATDNLKKATIKLNISNLNTDTYTGWTEPKEKTRLSDLPKLIKKTISEASYLTDADVSFQTSLDAVTWHNLPITKATVSGTIKDGDLTITNAEFSGVATATLKSAGIISDIGTKTAAVKNLSFSFSASQIPLFLGRAGLISSLPLLNTADQTKIAGSLTNTDDLWKSNIMAQLNDAELKINGTAAFLDDTTKLKDFNFNISHPNFHKFLTLINADTKPVENLNGALRAQGILNGHSSDFTLNNADISVGIQKVMGNLTYTDNGTKKLIINASSPALEVERIMPKMAGLTGTSGALSKKTFDFSKWDDWDITLRLNAGRLSYKVLDLNEAKLGLTFKDKVLNLSQFSGIQRGNSNAKFNAAGSLSYVSTPTIKADVEVADLTVRPDFMIVNKFSYGGGKMGLKGSFTASGSSIADMADNLNGNGVAGFSDGQFIGLDLAKVEPLVKIATQQNMAKKAFDTQMQRITSLGKTPVQSASGAFSIAKGIVRFMDMTIKTPVATASPAQITWNIPASVLSLSAPFQINGLNGYPPLILSVEMNKAQKAYGADYSDLSNMVAGLVQKDVNAKMQAEQQAEAALAEQARQTKEKAFKQTIEQASQAVQKASDAIKDSADDTAKALMQNALDALSIVNQLLLKENRTEEQNAMILEQARIAIQKSQEAQKAAAESATNYVHAAEKMEKSAMQMISKMEQMKQTLPHIVIIPRLITQAKQNLAIIQSIKPRLTGTNNTEQTAALAKAASAYQAIETAYANVMRFDTSAVVYTPVPEESGGIRGRITKK